MRFGIVDNNTLKVINVIEWNGDEWLPPMNTYVVRADVVDHGDSYDPITNTIIRADRTAI